MSGYKFNGNDLDNIFNKIDDYTDSYRSSYGINKNNSSTNLFDVNGNDLKDRYVSISSSSPYNTSITNDTGFKSNNQDLKSLFSNKTNLIRYEVTIEAERGGEGTNTPSLKGETGINYGAEMEIEVWLDKTKDYKLKKCNGGAAGVDPGNGDFRNGGRGGHSIALMDGGTVIAVPGAGGGDGAGNGARGASAFYEELVLSNGDTFKMTRNNAKEGNKEYRYDIFNSGIPDYGYLKDPNRVINTTYAVFNNNNVLVRMKNNNGDPASGYFYGLPARYRVAHGGDGGSNSGGASGGGNATSGGYLYGGKGGDSDTNRRSGSGGGGGAGMYGGGGGAEVNTTEGQKGSPGGGSGSSYYNTDTTYGITLKSLSPTKNTNANISIKNLNTNVVKTFTYSEISDETNIELP